MVHDVLIAAHAAAGVIAFAAGCAAISRRSAFAVYFASLVALVVFLAAVLGVDWPRLDGPSRSLYAVLTMLGGYLIWRAVQARRLLPTGSAHRSGRYLDHLGFTLVALFDGFAIIAVLTAGGPGWLAASIGVLGVGVGHVAIRRLKARLTAAPDRPGGGGSGREYAA